MQKGNYPYFRATVMIIGTAVVVLGLVTCAFATLRLINDVKASRNYGSTPTILGAALSLVVFALMLMRSSE
jgi:uncharacterized membrane protein YidH (DUF202 family)